MSEISLLDYFAGQALLGVMNRAEIYFSVDGKTPDIVPKQAAEVAYNYAQAMVKERCKRQGHRRTVGDDPKDYSCLVCGEEQKEDKK